MKHFILSFWLAIGIAGAAGQAKGAEPLSIARQGYFFAAANTRNTTTGR